MCHLYNIVVYVKKVIVAILAIVYMSTTSGATVHMHYCMGELLSWGLSAEKKEKCDNCGMQKGTGKDCCKDEHKVLKVENDQKAAENAFLGMQLAAVVLPSVTTGYVVDVLPNITESYPVTNGPPEGTIVPVYLRNCVFRI